MLAKFDDEKFYLDLRALLSDAAETMLDYWLASIEQEIAEGWRYYYAREIWFMENLPPPLINELGRAYACEQLRFDLSIRPGKTVTDRKQPPDLTYASVHAARSRYRNFLDVGRLALDALGDASTALDVVADERANELMRNHNRRISFEIRKNTDDWYLEASALGTMTPPVMVVPWKNAPPVRDESLSLEDDAAYWRAVHASEFRIVADVSNCRTKPDCTLMLMGELAPDFPFSAAHSTASRLVFVQTGDSPLAWALIIEKRDGDPSFRYPPLLVLLNRSKTKKLKDQDILFKNVIGKYFYGGPSSPRSNEIELRFHVPRFRRLIGFYASYVEAAIAKQR
jgi:hypothetical protein